MSLSRSVAALCSLAAAGCGGSPPPAPPAGTPAPTPAPVAIGSCPGASGFRHEHIPLPPEFAPSLPAGDEHLLFAPGMFDAGKDDYWSYAFTISFAAGAVVPPLEPMLVDYYRGLIAAVAESKKMTVAPDQVTVRVEPDEGAATIELVDAFTTGKPVTLHLRMRRDRACLRVAASPQPPDAAVWARLDAALACLPCR